MDGLGSPVAPETSSEPIAAQRAADETVDAESLSPDLVDGALTETGEAAPEPSEDLAEIVRGDALADTTEVQPADDPVADPNETTDTGAPPAPGDDTSAEPSAVVDAQADTETEAELADARAQILPPTSEVTAWTHLNGDSRHALGHPEGPVALNVAWSRPVRVDGPLDGVRLITAAPVVANGRVFVRDGGSGVHAFAVEDGAPLWSLDLTPAGEGVGEGYGGGLALSPDALIVTTGFGETVALDPSDGAEIWRTSFEAPLRAPPAVEGDTVYVVSRDDRAHGLDLETGERLWSVSGLSGARGALGGASPAAAAGVAAIPFASGELALVSRGGRIGWSKIITGGAGRNALGVFNDLTGDPVIFGSIVIAGNASGRTVAIDGRTGATGWTKDQGAEHAVWVAGDWVYLVTSAPSLQRLDLRTGEEAWTTPLDRRNDEVDGKIIYAGPTLAGGRLYVTANDGKLRVFDPVDGALIEEIALEGGASTGPVVADRTLFVLTDGGALQAFR